MSIDVRADNTATIAKNNNIPYTDILITTPTVIVSSAIIVAILDIHAFIFPKLPVSTQTRLKIEGREQRGGDEREKG